MVDTEEKRDHRETFWVLCRLDPVVLGWEYSE
jgi:hypothetical protein